MPHTAKTRHQTPLTPVIARSVAKKSEKWQENSSLPMRAKWSKMIKTVTAADGSHRRSGQSAFAERGVPRLDTPKRVSASESGIHDRGHATSHPLE